MTPKKAVALLLALVVVALAAFLVLREPPADDRAGASASNAEAYDPASLHADAAGLTANANADGEGASRTQVAGVGAGGATVRGRVLDGWSMQPLAGIEVLAVTTLPNFERFESRFRGTMMGLWRHDPSPPRVLGTTMSAGDGTFELAGLPTGRVFLDGRGDRYFVRTPSSLRLAGSETHEGVELLCFPGGRVRGRVMGPEGTPAAGALVSLRPGANAFLGQITSRNYRWLEVTADGEGYYDLRGVPEGHGYTVSAIGAQMALVEAHGVSVHVGETTTVDLQGLAGATLLGRVVDTTGQPVVAADVAMVYVDISRVLFSADGRGEPIHTDADGRFVVANVAPGLVAVMAAKDGLAPSHIEQLHVVDRGRYDNLVLELGEGDTLVGIVVDEADRPVAEALIEVVPMERPQDPDVVKMVLRMREVTTRTGSDGRFAVAGVVGDRLFVQASKPAYVTRVQFGVKRDVELRLKLERGASVRGKVAAVGGEPITRFRVEARSREVRDGEVDAEPEQQRVRRSMQGFAMGGRQREAGMRLSEGRKMSERRPGDEWQEMQAADGRFELSGLPPGKIRVRVRADGWLDPTEQEVTLASGQTSDELAFAMAPGLSVRGVVIDAASSRPVPEAQVTAYREENQRGRGFGMLRFAGDPEDFDFLGLSSMRGRRSVMTDGQGQFVMPGLTAGKYRFTARHPDRAKASAAEIEIVEGKETPEVRIELTAGGTIEGLVTGRAGRPVGNALIVAATISSGALKSSTTGPDGTYRIEGLPGGRYFVFKSRFEENATNLVYDLLGNMRLQTVTVKEGETARKDIQDETENSVRVFGVVRDGRDPVARAMVTALGQDNDGFLGIGIRAKPTDEKGEYELIGLKPGSYFFQVVRFMQRPEQANLSIDVPEGVLEYRVDLSLPQSSISGRVVDTAGQPVQGIQVAAGVEGGGAAAAPGLLGLILRNGVSRETTDADGNFKLTRMPEGNYRLTASGGNGRRQNRKYGEVKVGPFAIDGRAVLDNVLITLPFAGKVTGMVRDGNGAPVVGAEIGYVLEGASKPRGDELTDLFGVQRRPVRSGDGGTFLVEGLTPGSYAFTADRDDKTSEPADVTVAENTEASVTLTLIRGATLKIRVRNIDGTLLRPGDVQILDSRGEAVTKRMSAFSIFRRFMGNQDKKDDSGWREFGNVPPDTYTVVVSEEGKPDKRYTKTIKDGETVEWDVDMAATIKAEDK